MNICSSKRQAKQCLREIKLLQHFRYHKNITCLYDLDIPDFARSNELYLYGELMEADLEAIIRSRQPLTDTHYQSFTYQVLCGLKYIHSANVLHRDLKPSNLLVNANCELKICDFGLARGYSDPSDKNAVLMTHAMATRSYTAPEIMLSYDSYSKEIDLWSVGCILAEMLDGRPLFRSKDCVDQLNQILHILGTPDEPTLSRMGTKSAQEYIRTLPRELPMRLPALFPDANPQAIDLLEKLLAFDPVKRIDVTAALAHPYLQIWHNPKEEPTCATSFDSSYESLDSVDEIRNMICQEVINFRHLVRQTTRSDQVMANSCLT